MLYLIEVFSIEDEKIQNDIRYKLLETCLTKKE